MDKDTNTRDGSEHKSFEFIPGSWSKLGSVSKSTRKDELDKEKVSELSSRFVTCEASQDCVMNYPFTKKPYNINFSSGNGINGCWMTKISRILHDISYIYMMEGLKEYNVKNLYDKKFDSLRKFPSCMFYQKSLILVIYMLLAWIFFPSMWFYVYLSLFETVVSLGAKYMLRKSLKDATKDEMKKIILKYQPIFAVLAILPILICVWVFIWFIVIGAVLYGINYAREKEWLQQFCTAFNKLKSE